MTCCIAAVNFYGDADRFLPCNEDKVKPLDAAGVLDGAILLMAIFHIAEWVRTTFLFTVVVVGLNLMWIYYILGLNTLFGLIAVIYTMIVRFGTDGADCASVQTFRGEWLVFEIIIFWVMFFCYPGPILPLLCCKKEKHDAIINKEDDDEDGSDDD